MREDKFKPIKERFIDYFQQECRKICTDFRHTCCNVAVQSNNNPEYGLFSMTISCNLLSQFEEADALTLEICAQDWNNKFTIEAHICWEHPSGKLEAQIFEEPAEVNEKTLDIIQEKLPDLITKLREVIQDNLPK